MRALFQLPYRPSAKYYTANILDSLQKDWIHIEYHCMCATGVYKKKPREPSIRISDFCESLLNRNKIDQFLNGW